MATNGSSKWLNDRTMHRVIASRLTIRINLSIR
ncbi:unnamed protein product [Blumeria hordei]|uniref:Uncharacterized protein n=1 Tax=Blumeria hordei TaxID=2867405 RepID=A0A383UX13_BLUHO|nr:unnamed protein product [Blumeria hordei]